MGEETCLGCHGQVKLGEQGILNLEVAVWGQRMDRVEGEVTLR